MPSEDNPPSSSKHTTVSHTPTLSHSAPIPLQKLYASPPIEGREAGDGPSPRAVQSSSTLRTAAIIIIWIALSTSVILFNQRILVKEGFSYPIALTTLHLAFQTIATRLLHRFTSLISGPSSDGDYSALPTAPEDGSEDAVNPAGILQKSKSDSVAISWNDWKRQIVPPAALFSISLVLSNDAYLYLSVAYIHAFAPVAILMAAFAFGTKAFSYKLVAIVCVISFGTGVASWAEASFSLTGFFIQVLAIMIEATRVTLVEILLKGRDMSPLKTLYFFAPICLAINLVLVLPIEGAAPIFALPALGLPIILSNCCLTFALTLSTVYLIGVSSIVLSLSKVCKDIILVTGSTLLLGEKLGPLQYFGYAVATFGLFWYKMTPT